MATTKPPTGKAPPDSILGIAEQIHAVNAEARKTSGRREQCPATYISPKGVMVVPTDPRERSIFELQLLNLRALGFVKGRRGRNLHLTPDGKAELQQARP